MSAAGRNVVGREWPLEHVWIYSRRPSFAHNKTDACEYALFVWRAGHAGPWTGGWL